VPLAAGAAIGVAAPGVPPAPAAGAAAGAPPAGAAQEPVYVGQCVYIFSIVIE
jgi:hypothetical protein